ncbi:MAG: Gfo/Idh/MocA family oxidoreductase [Moorella humiferrea]|nr:Gfo/Idh/MocA family oxidoreductase [Moorella humiferrea]
MEKVKVGLLGAAFSAELHIDGYLRCQELSRVVAVCDRNLELARDFARRYNIPYAFGDADEMFALSEIDVIDICLPNFLHCEMAEKAFSAGKHVISEKPLATSVEEAERMVEAAQKAHKQLFYAEDWLFAPALLRAQELINQGAIGKPLFIKAKESHSGSHSPFAKKLRFCGGGAMIHLGVHPIGFLLALKGMPTAVMAMTTGGGSANFVHRDMEGEDWAAALLRFADGTTAIAEANYITLGGMNDIIEFYGTEGRLHIDLTMSSPITAYSRVGFDYAVEKAETTIGWTKPAVDERLMLGYIGEIRHFMSCLQEDKPAMKGLRGEDGLEVLKVIEAIYRSAREGRQITL